MAKLENILLTSIFLVALFSHSSTTVSAGSNLHIAFHPECGKNKETFQMAKEIEKEIGSEVGKFILRKDGKCTYKKNSNIPEAFPFWIDKPEKNYLTISLINDNSNRIYYIKGKRYGKRFSIHLSRSLYEKGFPINPPMGVECPGHPNLCENIYGGTPVTIKINLENNRELIKKSISNYIKKYNRHFKVISNEKNLEKYSKKELFLISNENWREVLSLVPVTTWTDKENKIHKYPTLIYHREDEGNNVDLDSIVRFINDYKPTSVTLVGKPKQEVVDLLGAKSGSNLPEDKIKVIQRDECLKYWESYDQVVYTNKYKAGLVASSYASLINAPLVTRGSFLEKLPDNKIVICVGSQERKECDKTYQIEDIQQKFIEETGTNKYILTNPNDLTINTPLKLNTDFTQDLIKDPKSKISLTSTFLAAAKHELIIPINKTNKHGAERDGETIDYFLDKKLEELGASKNNPLTTYKVYPKTSQNIYLYNLKTKNRKNILSPKMADRKQIKLKYPDIAENKVVWEQSKDGIILYDMTSDKKKKIGERGSFPKIGKELVVWQASDKSTGDFFLYFYSLGKEKIIHKEKVPYSVILKNQETLPVSIYNKKVVWDNGNQFILFDLDRDKKRKIKHYETDDKYLIPYLYKNSLLWATKNTPDLVLTEDDFFLSEKWPENNLYKFNLKTGERKTIYHRSDDSGNPIPTQEHDLDGNKIIFTLKNPNEEKYKIKALRKGNTQTVSEIEGDLMPAHNTINPQIVGENIIWEFSSFTPYEHIPYKGNIYIESDGQRKKLFGNIKKFGLDLAVSKKYAAWVGITLKPEIKKIKGYLTVVGTRKSIPLQKPSQIKYPESTSIKRAFDNYLYADMDNDHYSDLATGRITGLTISDASTLLARSLFYDKNRGNRKGGFFGSSRPLYLEIPEILKNKFKKIGFDSVVKTSKHSKDISPKKWKNKDIIAYFDHGKFDWAGIKSKNLPNLNGAVLAISACSTCEKFNSKSFCHNAIRQGAPFITGTISPIGASSRKNKMLNYKLHQEVYFKKQSLGVAFASNYRPETKEKYPYFAIGDPTLKPMA